MTPYYADDWLSVYHGDCRAVMAELPAESVHCVVTSPPYWGLRDYGTASWTGGDAGHDHSFQPDAGATSQRVGRTYQQGHPHRVCVCGATRVDSQLGLEPTPDEYVANLVAVFREVRRVLRDDGTVWLNLGDSYAGGVVTGESRPGAGRADGIVDARAQRNRNGVGSVRGLKPKDLVGIPWMVARALQEPYYTGRIRRERDRVWLAAMIDGEGTICGFDHDRADDGSHRSGVHVAITNTSTALLDEAARIWPTSRSAHQRPYAGHLGTKDSWRWIVHGIENKMAALRELYPYLIVKRQQAVVGYTLLSLMADAKRLGHSPQKDAVLAKRRVLTGLLSDLNHQRPVVMPSWLIEPPTLLEPGWYLRSDIIWSKPNPMPESVTDRPTKSHEYLFLLSKSARYFFDSDAVREAITPSTAERDRYTRVSDGKYEHVGNGNATSDGVGRYTAGLVSHDQDRNPAGRNIRSVWTVATAPYPGQHFATFPPKLIEPCIKAGTSEKGVCPECGAPWERVVERTAEKTDQFTPKQIAYQEQAIHQGGTRSSTLHGPGWRDKRNERDTTGWRPICTHISPLPPQPAVVLDMFAGSGTTGLVAQSLSRRAVLIDLSLDYLGQLMDRNRDIPLGLGA